MAGEVIGEIIGHGVDSIIGIGIFNVKLSIIVNNTSKWGIMVHHYEGGDWNNARPDDQFQIIPYDEEVQRRHNQESEWAEEFRVDGNGLGRRGGHPVHVSFGSVGG